MTTHKGFLFLVLLAAPLAGLAAGFFAVTPSGSAEVMFAGKASEVVGKLSSRCIDVQWTVVTSSDNAVVCEAPLSTGQSLMGQMLLGNSYSTPPRRFFRFNIGENAGVSRVQASGWMETQMAFGQVQRVDFSGAEFHNGMMGFMTSAGGSYPVGTTFPHHVVMGFNAKHVQQGKFRTLQVQDVVADTAAARAGLQAGDVVTRIAGRRFKNDDEYLEALEKAARSATYAIEVTRDGKPLTLTLDRAFRPAYTVAVVAAPDPATDAPPAAAPVSVADELAKLLALKEQGVLTQAEFDAQKAKLLAQ